MNNVAVAQDVSASAGSTLYTGADSGTWKAGPVTVLTYAKVKVGSDPVAYEATCQYTFNGKTGTSPTSGFSSVTLRPNNTVFHQQNVLVDGDSESDEFGNEISVSASGKLKTE